MQPSFTSYPATPLGVGLLAAQHRKEKGHDAKKRVVRTRAIDCQRGNRVYIHIESTLHSWVQALTYHGPWASTLSEP